MMTSNCHNWAMPAECEVPVGGAACAVLAIGRCQMCSRSFCMTHQGLIRDGYGGPWAASDRCRPCSEDAEREKQERTRQMHDQQPAQRIGSRHASESAGDVLRGRLRAANIPATPLVEVVERRRLLPDVTRRVEAWRTPLTRVTGPGAEDPRGETTTEELWLSSRGDWGTVYRDEFTAKKAMGSWFDLSNAVAPTLNYYGLAED